MRTTAFRQAQDRLTTGLREATLSHTEKPWSGPSRQTDNRADGCKLPGRPAGRRSRPRFYAAINIAALTGTAKKGRCNRPIYYLWATPKAIAGKARTSGCKPETDYETAPRFGLEAFRLHLPEKSGSKNSEQLRCFCHKSTG